MRMPVTISRSPKISHAVAVALMASTVAGCSSEIARFGDTDNQRSILSGSPAPAPFDTTGSINAAPAPVSRAVLPPPATQGYAPPPAQNAPVYQPPRVATQPTYSAPAYGTPTYTPPPVAAAPAPIATPTANGWQVGPNAVVLKQGETIDTLSRRYGIPSSAILQANNFADGSRVTPGTRIVIPTYSVPAPAVAAAPAPHVAVAPPRLAAAPTVVVKPAPAPVVTATVKAPSVTATAVTGVKVGPHIVRSGESLERIAASYGISKAKLKEANGLKHDDVKPGQKLLLPSGAVLRLADKGAAAPAPQVAVKQMPAPAVVAAPAPAVVVPAPQIAVKPMPGKPGETRVAAIGAPPAAAPAPSTPETIAIAKEPGVDGQATRGEAKSGTPSFRWPVRGRVIKEFGSANGERNDGINLAVPEGTSIKAAEDGEVIYSGNELKGYGNLVLVRHQDGWVTAYAHASELLVNKGERITRGQIIARAGATGGVNQPQLHFEIRKGQRPVDPKQFLASN
ncbi:peptidoglycan DD-metalloendopeptidase family protein [Prosthecodimorpha hirschii]|uniref:peptidoglycan DD-metalloendopeptidase family protein n=1 Tax=Prosthecodimorpha hirschii TaxID=665126 RepID=UPI00112A07F1|nr:peptidoglycan DD-metalloendopeptidase family protein [Prosthecomicrobium hirschii]